MVIIVVILAFLQSLSMKHISLCEICGILLKINLPGAATVENSMEFPQKTKNEIAF